MGLSSPYASRHPKQWTQVHLKADHREKDCITILQDYLYWSAFHRKMLSEFIPITFMTSIRQVCLHIQGINLHGDVKGYSARRVFAF